jgi:Trypsin-like peptidase domain/Effector-associated domain 1
MVLSLDGPKRESLRNALLSAFPGWPALQRMTSDYLDLSLVTVTAQHNDLETQAFDLIEWARAHGKMADLVLGARYANPDNPDLFVFAQKLGINSSDQSKSTLEAFVGSNQTFLDVAVWRAQLSKLEWCMCRVDVDDVGMGTGFLIGPDVVLTNHHVVRKAIDAAVSPTRLSCLFDFKYAENQVLSNGNRYSLVDGENWKLGFSPHSTHDLESDPKSGEPAADELDFAMLRLAQPAGQLPAGGFENGQQRHWIELGRDTVDFATKTGVAILQHPRREPLKLAIGMNEQIKLNGAGNRIRYAVPTLPGSSGSPIFDTDWELVALHHSGDPDSIKPEYNEGIPISVIAKHPAVAAYLEELDDLE